MSDAQLTSLVLAALLSENFLLVSCLAFGTRPKAFLDTGEGWRTGLCLTFVMVCTTLLSRGLDLFLLQMRLDFLRLLVFALMVPGTIWALRKLIALFLPALSQRVDEAMGSLTSNAAGLGCVLIVSQRSYDVSQSFVYALFGGLGATLVMVSFAGLRQEVSFDSCPKAFRGAPILLVTAGLMALALMGYYGLYIP